MTAAYLWLWNGSAFIKAECDADGYIKVVEQNLDSDGLIQQSAHHKGYNYGTSEWDKVGITANHELKVSMTGLDDYILKSLFNANTILYATTDDTPVALTLDEQRILGRITGGNIAALTQTQMFDFINSAGDIAAARMQAHILAAVNASTEVDKIGNAQLDDIAWAKVTKTGSSLADMITRSAGDLSSGDLAAARMSANIVAAIAGLDPTLTTLTFDSVESIRRDVSDSYLRIYGGTPSLDEGAAIVLIGRNYTTADGGGANIVIVYDSAYGSNPYFTVTLNDKIAATFTTLFKIDRLGHVTPQTTAGSSNFGDASKYWNDISYKTLTDRGCLGLFDRGVEMPDGRILSDLDALKAIQSHPTRETVYGVKQLDYRTMPKAVFKPAADVDGVLFERDENNEPKPFIEKVTIMGDKKPIDKLIETQPADGAELTALVSIMLGAIKELSVEVENLKRRTG